MKSAGWHNPEIRGRTLAVIGGGSWGTTLAVLQADNFRRVNLCVGKKETLEEIAKFHTNERYAGENRIPENVFATTILERALDGASMAVVAVPSHAVREVATSFKGIFADRLPVVIATKGLERGTGLLSIEVWRREMAVAGRRVSNDPMVLSGPNLARELLAGSPAVSLLAGVNPALLHRAATALTHRLLSLVMHDDPVGAQVSGALKNVYAIACGIARGLCWGDNAAAAIIWRGLSETATFARAVGGNESIVATPAGIGDFVATCTSPLSRNHDLGRRFATGRGDDTVEGVAEGASTVGEAVRRSRALGLELPLLAAVGSVLGAGSAPEAILEAAVRGETHTTGQRVARSAGRSLEGALNPG